MNHHFFTLPKSYSNNRVLALLAFSACLFMTLSTQAKMDKAQEARLVKTCEAIQNDATHDLRRMVKVLHTTPRKIISGLKCNGMDPLEFAKISGSDQTLAFLHRYTTRDNVYQTKGTMLSKK